MTDRYAVVGKPIAHSKSPDIHALFSEQTGEDIQYDRILVEVGEFDQNARKFFENGGKGLNVTTPFKDDAFEFADVLTNRAKLAGAVNTLAMKQDGKILGDTTDGVGLVADIKRQGWTLTGKRVLIIGAGGAVRGVIKPLLDASPESIYIANRTADKAQLIADVFEGVGNVLAGGLGDLADRSFDIIINGSSAGLSGGLPDVSEDIFSADRCVYDMSYAFDLTPFLTWAKGSGVKQLSDGLGMLVEQAAESFYIWRGVRPDTAPVIAALQRAL